MANPNPNPKPHPRPHPHPHPNRSYVSLADSMAGGDEAEPEPEEPQAPPVRAEPRRAEEGARQLEAEQRAARVTTEQLIRIQERVTAAREATALREVAQAALEAERKWRHLSPPRRARSVSPPPSSSRDAGYGGRHGKPEPGRWPAESSMAGPAARGSGARGGEALMGAGRDLSNEGRAGGGCAGGGSSRGASRDASREAPREVGSLGRGSRGGHATRSPAAEVEEMHRTSLQRPSLLEEARDARRKIYEQVKRAESAGPLSRSAAFTVVSRRLSGR